MNTATTTAPTYEAETIVALNEKIDRLTEQVTFLAEEARQQQLRRQEWDDLKDSADPIIKHVFQLSVKQLQEIEQDVQLEDLLRLSKRVLRNVRNFEMLLDQIESGVELLQDVTPIGHNAFLSLIKQLHKMEQKGYFIFLQGGLDMMDKVVTSFTEEDVRQLSDNIVLILKTVKDMTQPEIMHMVHTSIEVVEEEPTDTSLLGIIKQLNDPAVKKGLVKTLNILKNVSTVKNGKS